MHENGKRIALLAAVIAIAAILGSSLIPTSAIQQGAPNQTQDPFMSMPQMSQASQMQTALSGPTVHTVGSGDWSDSSTWNSSVPLAGENVIISPGTTVTYSGTSSAILGTVEVQGSLIFSNSASTQLTFTNMTIDYGGLLQLGTTASPVPSSVTATLALAPPSEGASMIMVMGDLEIHGSPLTPTWTRLASTAQAGAKSLTLSQAVGWKAGDHIVVASTSLNPAESEEDWIASVSGNTVLLQNPLKYEHDGTAPTQAEVADLTRNVVVTSATATATSGIHASGVMFMMGATGGISYAEFSHLGGKGILGDYPIHFHHVQNTMDGTVINGVSIWDSHNRFITLHNSDGITIENTVGYKSIGHGFFMEDGTEENNTLMNDLAILTLPGKIRPDDGGAAGFWVQNPRNNLTDDVAVSCAGSGFDLSIADKAPDVVPFNIQNFLESNNTAPVFPRNLKITAFVGNEAHSNRGDGLHLYRLNGVRHGTISWFTGLTMWRNGNVGVDITGSQFNVTSSLFFGNYNGGMRIDGSDATVTQNKFLGELVGAPVPGRFSISVFGIEVSGSMMTISDNYLQGHLPRGAWASADIVNNPDGGVGESVFIVNDQLLSQRQIIFGYPLNGMSYFDVEGLNGNSSVSYSLWRYDLPKTLPLSTTPVPAGMMAFIATCTVSTSNMWLTCPLVTATVWKSLHS
jgi:hypothetical protein